jgi:tetraacyldisaccharide 4'-kinase
MIRNYLYNIVTDRQKGFIAGLLKILLFILSLIYGLTLRLLIFFYSARPCRLDCKVISIGNITLGGTGKTSFVEFIAKFLRDKGHNIAILSRGYKKGDEPDMLKKNLGNIPVIVDRDRICAARRALADYAVDAVILDDGFQQWKIKKDLEIVAVDVTNPFGNQHLLPRGILREPLSSLKRADVFVLTKTNLNPDFQEIKDFLSSLNPKAPIIETVHYPKGFYKLLERQALLSPDVLRGKTVTLFCAIGDPDSFENLITSLGINIGLSFRFPDHHDYSQQDLENIVKQTQSKNIELIITTHKDAVRMPYLVTAVPIFVLRIELVVTKNEQRLFSRLSGLFSA